MSEYKSWEPLSRPSIMCKWNHSTNDFSRCNYHLPCSTLSLISGPYNCNSSYNSSAESGSAINRIGRVTGPNTGRAGYSCSTGCCAGAGWMTHSGYVPCQSGDTPVPTHHALIDKDNVHGFGGMMCLPTSRARVGRISTSGIHGSHPNCISSCCSTTLRL